MAIFDFLGSEYVFDFGFSIGDFATFLVAGASIWIARQAFLIQKKQTKIYLRDDVVMQLNTLFNINYLVRSITDDAFQEKVFDHVKYKEIIDIYGVSEIYFGEEIKYHLGELLITLQDLNRMVMPRPDNPSISMLTDNEVKSYIEREEVMKRLDVLRHKIFKWAEEKRGCIMNTAVELRNL